MRDATIEPREQERPFRHDEFFFSTTDRKGVILGGNDVFVRVSGYAVEDLVGQPHNIIRHPDMPRAIFRLLWDYLERDHAFAGYVKNMAADGCYYWVMALIVPVREGFLSVRFKPRTSYFDAARRLYPQLLARERAAGADWRSGMDEARLGLEQALSTLGFSSYDHFMQTALAAELAAIDARPASRTHATTAEVSRHGDPAIARFLEASGTVDRQLGTLFISVDEFLATIRALDDKATFLLNLSANVHLMSLNALISSCRLQDGGEGLAVVSQTLATQSHDSMRTIDAMTKQLSTLTAALRDTAFSLSAAKLEVEMAAFFLNELSSQSATPDRIVDRRRIATLAEAISASASALGRALPRAQAALPQLLQLQHALASDLRRLSCVHVLGKIHAAGVDEGGVFVDLLARIFEQVSKATDELQELLGGVTRVRERLQLIAVDAQRAQPSVDRFCDLAATA